MLENVIYPAHILISGKKRKSAIFVKEYFLKNLHGPSAVSMSWTLMMETEEISETCFLTLNIDTADRPSRF
jgi:hypothetical protein